MDPGTKSVLRPGESVDIWQYGLSNFQGRDRKLDRILAKIQRKENLLYVTNLSDFVSSIAIENLKTHITILWTIISSKWSILC